MFLLRFASFCFIIDYHCHQNGFIRFHIVHFSGGFHGLSWFPKSYRNFNESSFVYKCHKHAASGNYCISEKCNYTVIFWTKVKGWSLGTHSHHSTIRMLALKIRNPSLVDAALESLFRCSGAFLHLLAFTQRHMNFLVFPFCLEVFKILK